MKSTEKKISIDLVAWYALETFQTLLLSRIQMESISRHHMIQKLDD